MRRIVTFFIRKLFLKLKKDEKRRFPIFGMPK
jgi:hypothetical protein